MNASPARNRALTLTEITELLVLLGGMAALTAVGTWLAERAGVPAGWRLAASACAAILIVASARLAYHRRGPTWRWFGALIALWALMLLANALAAVRLW